MSKKISKDRSCGHKKSAVKSEGRSWRLWESLATEAAEVGHLKCDTCKLLHLIANLAEPTGVGALKYSTKRAVAIAPVIEIAA
ncbi:MAG: hypothetical protein RLZ28_957 [Actinomycetota bacterium]|jgi:hypothetical protein